MEQYNEAVPEMTIDAYSVARAIFKAYETKDLNLAQSLLAENFTFTSPLDNKLDRDMYFKICWPNSTSLQKFDIKHMLVDKDTIAVTYEATATTRRFRNTEIFTIHNGRITSVEVYFGWDLPHKAAAGQHINPT